MRRRRPVPDEVQNNERWMISYADFITLLFAFFVVLYSISSVNEGEYDRLAKILISVFNVPPSSLDPIQIGEIMRQTQEAPVDLIERPDNRQQTAIAQGDNQEDAGQGASGELESLNKELEAVFSDLIEDNLVAINGNQLWVEVLLPSSYLFNSGSAIPREAADLVLFELAEVLLRYQMPVRVEGHTDDQSINTRQFPSNWELSAARAAAVVRLLQSAGINPALLSAAGYAQYQPLADNFDEEGRAINRRISVFISRQGSDKRGQVTP